MKSLRHLDLTFFRKELRRPETLGELSALRFLNVFCRSVTSVDWCRRLTSLETLVVAGTAVEDLSPLAALPMLREIEAESSKVSALGTGFPSLAKLNVLACPLSAETAEAFQRDHPRCEVLRGYRESLVAAVSGATRVRVRSGGTCHRDKGAEKTLVELKAAADIDALVDLLVFEEGAEPFHCECCGDPSFEFYEGDRMVAVLGFHHGQGMRWANGPWPGDVRLKGGKGLALREWLEQRSVKGPGEGLRESLRQKATLE